MTRNEPAYQPIVVRGREIGGVQQQSWGSRWGGFYTGGSGMFRPCAEFATRQEAVEWVKGQDHDSGRQVVQSGPRGAVQGWGGAEGGSPDLAQLCGPMASLIGMGFALGVAMGADLKSEPTPPPVDPQAARRQAEIDALREQNELLKQLIRQQAGSSSTSITKRK